jgi:hypothetical protein
MDPKLYNGRDRTFFFFNYEMYRDRQRQSGTFGTVPTDAFRNGEFSAILTGRVLGTDPLGRPIMENTIYDPLTRQVVNGQVVRNPFPNNIIPTNRFDPVAAKVQDLIPRPTRPGSVNNFEQVFSFRKIQAIPSIKVDHSFTSKAKLAAYYSHQRTDKDNGQDGLPDPISKRRDQFIRSDTVRLNFDYTLARVSDSPRRRLPALYNPDAASEHHGIRQHQPARAAGAFASGFPASWAWQFLRRCGRSQSYESQPLSQDKPTAVASASLSAEPHLQVRRRVAVRDVHERTPTTSRARTGSPVETGFRRRRAGAPGRRHWLPVRQLPARGQQRQRRILRTAISETAWALSSGHLEGLAPLTLDYGLRYDSSPRPNCAAAPACSRRLPNPPRAACSGTIYEGPGMALQLLLHRHLSVRLRPTARHGLPDRWEDRAARRVGHLLRQLGEFQLRRWRQFARHGI